MRLLVFFDLPVVTEKDKKNYQKFRNFLLDNSFIMIQYSVYVRICRNQDDLEKHINRIKSNLPPEGNIRLLQVTEKQYEKMEVLRGQKSTDEQFSIDNMLIFD
ncbi:MAG: CRISPR-associated endonuclease Cas2 [Mollicutes bacterium]|nr:CRISPR-associated endonuclease Cas2 [Mollicutes bacterium]